MSTDQSHKQMQTRPHRTTAVVVGGLFIACTVASILSVLPLGGPVVAPVDAAELAQSSTAVVATALIEFVWAATGAGIAIGLYPVIRDANPGLALGSVAGRLVEAVLVVMGALSLLVLLSVSEEGTGVAFAGPLLATREWVHGLLGPLAFALGALLYYVLLYRTELIPRWLSVWGLVGIGLGVVATLYAGFTEEFGLATVNTMLNFPIFLQEMVLAGWLILRGFDDHARVPGAVEGR